MHLGNLKEKKINRLFHFKRKSLKIHFCVIHVLHTEITPYVIFKNVTYATEKFSYFTVLSSSKKFNFKKGKMLKNTNLTLL